MVTKFNIDGEDYELKDFSAVGQELIKRLVFVSGVFNILHPGHFRLLRFAKECGGLVCVSGGASIARAQASDS